MIRSQCLVLPGLAALLAVLACGSAATADDSRLGDESQLQAAGIATDGPGLLAYFRKLSLTDQDRKRIELLVQQLGSRRFKERSRALRELQAVGPAAMPFLKSAANDSDPEVRREAALCLGKITAGPGPELPAAAARLLVHQRPVGAVAALLNYLPHVQDEWLEEEVFTCLGQLAMHRGKVDPVLTGALADSQAMRRGAAAYVLGRGGDMRQRAAVRKLLADPEATVRQRAAWGLVGKEVYQTAEESADTDEKLFREHQGAAAEGDALLAFFRKRTLSAADQRRLRELVRQLGADVYPKRQRATHELVQFGSSALPLLRSVLDDADAEIVRRAKQCIDIIEKGPGPALPIAAVHIVLRRPPPCAVETLLAYLPFADDDQVEDEVLSVLCALNVREVKVSPALSAALKDEQPARRAAAAFVLGHVGTRSDIRPARVRLADAVPQVRFRAAEGFLAAQDRTAMPVLINLLADASDPALHQRVEDALNRVAGDQGPALNLGSDSPAERQRVRVLWQQWWHRRQANVDLALGNRREVFRNLRLICEFEWNGQVNTGKVWECGRDGKARWQIANLQGPMDAQVLPGGNVLVAENSGRRVAEFNRAGQVRWEKRVSGHPVGCRRLPNGNTFIACYYNVMIVKPDGTVVYNRNWPPNTYIFCGAWKRNGNIVYLTSQGQVVEVDPRTNKEVKSFTVANQGGWCGVEALRNGNYLIAMMASSKILETDGHGRVAWQCNLAGAHTATRLPNGHILAACMNTKKIVELDRSGKEVWALNTAGRPWRIHYR